MQLIVYSYGQSLFYVIFDSQFVVTIETVNMVYHQQHNGSDGCKGYAIVLLHNKTVPKLMKNKVENECGMINHFL